MSRTGGQPNQFPLLQKQTEMYFEIQERKLQSASVDCKRLFSFAVRQQLPFPLGRRPDVECR
jgi:hypothetical protein